jgi:hypothetical protein
MFWQDYISILLKTRDHYILLLLGRKEKGVFYTFQKLLKCKLIWPSYEKNIHNWRLGLNGKGGIKN